MKKNYVILAILFFSFSLGCKEKNDQFEQNNKGKNFFSFISEDFNYDDLLDRIIGPTNNEILRIYEDIYDHEDNITVVDNPNFGSFSSSPQYDIFIGGSSQNGVQLKINGTPYEPLPAGNFLKQSLEFKSYYGTNVNFELSKNGISIENKTIYIPEQALAMKLSDSNSVEINRTGNMLSWNVDQNNLSQKVILHYSLYNNQDFISNQGLIDSDFKLLEDNGSFNIDNLISNNQVKRIAFKLVRGNGFSADIEGIKTFINIRSVDHHEYTILD
jgi:hypothetical protein